VLTDHVLKSNTYTYAALPVANGKETDDVASILHLRPPEREYYSTKLTHGEVIIRLGDRWREPILASFPPPTHDKIIEAETWDAARARTNAHAPRPIPVPEPSTTRAAADAPEPAADTTTTALGLSIADEALMRAIAKETIPTVTAAYKAANLPAQVGDRARNKIEALGLITRSPIVASAGKGGAAVGLQLTDKGYERLNIKPPHLTRGGGSAQHLYLVVNISKHLKGAMVETTLGEHGNGGKSIDIILRITPENAERVAHLTDTFHTFNEEPITPAEGDLVAIEIETTHTTAANNAIKNLAVGVAFNITATMPKAVEKTKQALLKALPTAALSRVVVADALELLEALKG